MPERKRFKIGFDVTSLLLMAFIYVNFDGEQQSLDLWLAPSISHGGYVETHVLSITFDGVASWVLVVAIDEIRLN